MYILYACVYICVYVYVCGHVYTYICACVYVYVYVCVYTHVYVYVYAYLCIDCGSQYQCFSVWTFLAAALTCVMCAAVPIPAVAAASVLHSAAVGGSVAGDVGPL